MEAPRTLAAALSLSRVAFGLSYLARPQGARESWIGRAAKKPGTQVIVRAQGARDVALGAGAIRALVRGEVPEMRAWVVAQAGCDLVDLIATWSARDALPRRRARMAMAVAGVSTVVAGGAAAGLTWRSVDTPPKLPDTPVPSSEIMGAANPR
jgi:hypothetical protein